MVGSIPVFIASGRNKRRGLAITAQVKIRQNHVGGYTGLLQHSLPAMSIKLNF